MKRSLLAEAIGQRLVAAGQLSADEFKAIRNEALRQICSSAEDVTSIVHPTKRGSVTVGSWEIKELVKDTEGVYQVLSAWVKDRHMRPITLHKHDGVECLILLKGAILISIDGESQIVTAPGTVTIPMRAVHSVTPLERDTQMLVAISPPEPGYMVEQSA